jgi:MATE family multidrug resistance protein
MSSEILVPSLHHSLAYNIKRTLELAAPVTVSRALMMTMIMADNIMAGQAGPQTLAFYGLAFALHMPLFVLSLGLMTGVSVLTAQAEGAAAPARCGPIWRKGLMMAAVLGLAGFVSCLFGEPFLLLVGQEASLAKGAGEAFFWFGVGLPGLLFFIVCSFFAEGLSRPRTAMFVTLAGNLINILGNWLLIEGQWGLPGMGASGAALALSITRWVMAGLLFCYILFLMRGREAYALWPGQGDKSRASLRALLALGVPFGTAIGLESLAFATLANFAGSLGELPLAAYQAAMNMNAFIFMIALGVSAAAAVRVGNAVGREDRKGVALAGWTGLAIVLFQMALMGIVLFFFPRELAGIYNEDPLVVTMIVASLAVLSVSVLFDGVQAVMMGALRGAGDVVVPTAVHLFAFWMVGLPAAWYFGLEAGCGVPGLFFGMVAGLLAASSLLGLRFAVVSRRAIRPFGT